MALPTTNELRELLPYLTPQERAELDSLLAVEGRRRTPEYDDLTVYKRLMYRNYAHAPHLEALDRALMQVTEYVETGGKRGIGRLIVEMPPRHGKTLTVSRMYPTWHLGRNPDSRVMLVSYGATLAQKNSRVARNLIKSDRYRDTFGITLADDSAAVDSWDIAGHEGGCDAMGITGGATGKGAHVLVIDDPVKSRAEAESETYRENVWEGFTNDLYTRLEPGGAVVVMMTRWHQDDLIGRLLKHEPDVWTRLRLPAIAEEDEPTRNEGEALWPLRYPVDTLNQIRATIGSYAWAALYQQRPQPREGGLFKWQDIDSHRVQPGDLPAFTRVVVAIDPSGSAKGDAVGIVVTGVARDGHGYVLEDRTMNASPDQWGRVAVTLYHKWKADRIVAEKNFGGDMVEHVIRTVDKSAAYRAVSASRGKELRAEPVAALYEQGKVHHAGRFDALEDEMTTWSPGGDSPNRMDALVWGLTELMLQGRVMGADAFAFMEW